MGQKILFLIIPLILSIGIIPALSFGETIDSPRKQMQNGIAAKDVVCKSGLALMIRTSGDAACVKPSSAEKLTAAGFGIIEKEASKVTTTDELTPDEAKGIAEKAFIYAYPMLENYHTMYDNTIDDSSERYVAPFNVIHNNDHLSTPDDKVFVSPNSDTVYTYIWLDLRAEPVIFTVPVIDEGRYYTLQFVDYYTNNFAYIGERTIGYDGGTFLIGGTSWDGNTPQGIDGTFQSETDFVYVLGRTQVLNNDDTENALAIMQKYDLKTQSEFLGKSAPPAPPSINFISWDKERLYGSDFVNYFNLMLTWSETPSNEKQMFEDFAKIGVKEGATVDWSKVDPDIKDAIGQGAKAGFDKIKENIADIGEFQNGWSLTLAFGDADYRAENYLQQATGAMLGLYGNTKTEAFYPVALTDADKNPLDTSKNNYVFKFASEPPVDAFWSVTMYDGKTQLLVDNPIDRYLVNSLIDLEKNDDGSFEVYVQHDSPGDDKESNWLPAPDGEFYTVLRLYLPEQEILDDQWEMPKIVVEKNLE